MTQFNWVEMQNPLQELNSKSDVPGFAPVVRKNSIKKVWIAPWMILGWSYMLPSATVRNKADENTATKIPRFADISLEYSMKQFTRKQCQIVWSLTSEAFFLVPTETTAKTADSYLCSTNRDYGWNINWTLIVCVIRHIKKVATPSLQCKPPLSLAMSRAGLIKR